MKKENWSDWRYWEDVEPKVVEPIVAWMHNAVQEAKDIPNLSPLREIFWPTEPENDHFYPPAARPQTPDNDVLERSAPSSQLEKTCLRNAIPVMENKPFTLGSFHRPPEYMPVLCPECGDRGVYSQLLKLTSNSGADPGLPSSEETFCPEEPIGGSAETFCPECGLIFEKKKDLPKEIGPLMRVQLKSKLKRLLTQCLAGRPNELQDMLERGEKGLADRQLWDRQCMEQLAYADQDYYAAGYSNVRTVKTSFDNDRPHTYAIDKISIRHPMRDGKILHITNPYIYINDNDSACVKACAVRVDYFAREIVESGIYENHLVDEYGGVWLPLSTKERKNLNKRKIPNLPPCRVKPRRNDEENLATLKALLPPGTMKTYAELDGASKRAHNTTARLVEKHPDKLRVTSKGRSGKAVKVEWIYD